MLIKDFAKVGTKVGQMTVTQNMFGYGLAINKDGWDIVCSTTRGEVRRWKALDVLKKHVASAGFVGSLVIVVTNQADLF